MNRFTRLCMIVPWLTALAMVVLYATLSYRDGLHFAAGLHGMKWIALMIVGLFVHLSVVLALSCGLMAAQRKQPQTRANGGRTVLVMISSVLLAVAALPTMAYTFRAGRTQAYHRLDPKRIYLAAVELGEAARQQATELSFETTGNLPPTGLPDTLAQLHPRAVYASADAVVIQMDGGGPALREGLAVFLNPTIACPPALQSACQPLDEQLPVFRYLLDDSRIILDECAQAAATE